MEELSFLFGVLGNITSVLVLLSPIGTFSRIIKNRSTEEFESFPYISMLLNASLWTYYGIIKPNALLVATVNGFGVIIQILYLSLFLLFAPPKMKAKTAAMAVIMNVSFVVAAILVTRLEMEGELQIKCIGFVCSCFTIVCYVSPMSVMRTVVTTKSVEYMPFFLSFFLCINGIIWTVYAILVRDYFIGVSFSLSISFANLIRLIMHIIQVPNGAGFVLGASQLVLYALYRNAKASKSPIDGLEEGWQHQQLIIPSSDCTSC
ncbi:hypothetical protein BUALT_Bualt14G0063800 [Buddleja alternifolia]|uniref:Bidirectional sugar transporter SWEET n=1 Tax=Buddleja alternifolia TaxID=168488 RepID=A0AAV6WSL8_9LAMI|nr:hypothetical protein BUALT_Bualt14G0063800 [Buddleja alternifolia]